MMIRCARVDELLRTDEESVLLAMLPDWRRRKVEALRFPDDRRRSIAVWLLLSSMLAEHGLDAKSLKVVENAYGKPSFDPPAGLHFSLSHAGDCVMAALAASPIGCDIEKIAPVSDEAMAVALTSEEWMALAGLADADRDRFFIRLWVRKESYLKAVGCGMDISPASFSALRDPPSSEWIWRDFLRDDGYWGCVCHCAGACEF